jgi:uncharacterized MAPEG superfamily protein
MSPQTATETEGRQPRAGHDGQTTGTRRTFTETKNGFKTSEFYVTVVFVAGVLIAAYATGEDALARDDGWLFASLAVVGYIVSRGLAKVATREPYEDRDR